ncbi:MAG TPA: ABC transporter permease [Acidimicrobiales bacterium]
MRRAALLSWWRFRSTFSHRWGGYLGVVLVVGILGGVAMGAVAGARRTQGAFPVYLASTNPSDVVAFDEYISITGIGHSARVDRAIARLPYVERATYVIGFDPTLAQTTKAPVDAVAGEQPPAFEGSLNGEFTTVDRATVVQGRMFDPNVQDELVMSASGAAEYGLHIGSTLATGVYSDAQVSSAVATGVLPDRPYVSIRLKLVGIVESSSQVVQDDDAALGSQFGVFTPALTRRLTRCCAGYSYVALKLDGGTRHETTVVRAIERLVPAISSVGGGQDDVSTVALVERSIRPESIAFGAFGLIAALAALLIGAQVVGRVVRTNADDGEVLRALGAGPVMTTADGLVGVLGAVVFGAILAVVVAIGLSPFSPFGAVRPLYPDLGVAFDWTVLGLGLAVLVVVLGVVSVLLAYRAAPYRGELVRRRRAERAPTLSRVAAASGLGPSATTGIRSALGSGVGRDVAPVRSAILGSVLAVVVVVTSIIFGASLTALVSHPRLYGWNWNYVLLSGFSGAEDLPAAQTAALLDHDPNVAHWAGVYFEDAMIDGRQVGVLAVRPNAAVVPTPLTGHPLQSADQVVLGPATLAALHKQLGDTVVANTGGRRPVHLHIVGTATMPTIGGSGSPDLQMGNGAVMASTLFPAGYLNTQGSPVPGPDAFLITIRPGVSSSVARHSLDRIDRLLNGSPDGPVGGVVSVLRPAEIADYGAVGSTPTLLASVLAAGALGALGLTLVSSVRRRRQELALLKTLGLTGRQLGASVAWQSSVSVGIGVVIGMPIGIALGRGLWTLFAEGISAVPDPTVPALAMVLIALGALCFANVVAAVPGRIAARTPTALLLHSE